ncbi:MAG: glycosyltransferase family 4 protein, partial [Candidatus Odinarchaeota archaeon]
MFRILRIVPFYAPAYGYGGPVVHTVNISKQQAALGHDVRIFTTNIFSHKLISNKLPKFEVIDKVKVHRFPIRYRLGQSHYFVTPTLPFSFFKYNYDLIHVHSFRTFQNDVATLVSKIRKKPLIFTAHGTLRSMYLLNLFDGKKREENRMKFYDLIYKKFFIKNVDRFIVHSQHEKIWALNFNVPEEKIRVIPHGINLV